jgi:site-specific DNA-methyltransferase (adenine-specific)
MMIVEQMLKNAPNPLLHIADVSGSALFQGDCLEIMPLIPDKSVQLILADLPYGEIECKWDSIIPFDKLWEQYERIITDNGAIVLTATLKFALKLINSNERLFKYELIWDKVKPSNIFIGKLRPLNKHEFILIFSKGNIANGSKTNMLYNPQMEKQKPRTSKLYGQSDMWFRESLKSESKIRDEKYPKSILTFSNANNKNKQHPTQKPIDMMKFIISSYSNENDMVLDNTMGSGTTCLAAKELNRKFIGIEKETNYYEIACRRCGF